MNSVTGVNRSKPRTLRPQEVRFPETGVFALESRHARGFAMPPTRHDYLKILPVFSGKGELRGRFGRLPLERGDAAVVPPGCEHWIEDHRPLSLHALCLRPETFRDGWPKSVCESGKPLIFHQRDGEMSALARRLLHEQSGGRPGAPAMVRALAWQLLALLARLPRGKPRPGGDPTGPAGSRARVEEAGRDMRHRFYEPLRIDEEAARAGLGRRRFTQLFRETHGRTWWEALNDARLEHARRLLRETDRSVVAVAFECGYGDLSGFYRAWGACHADSPLVWRARAVAGTAARLSR